MDRMVMEHDLRHFTECDFDELVLQSPHGYARRTVWTKTRLQVSVSSLLPAVDRVSLVVLVANPDNDATVERVRQALCLTSKS